MASELTTNALRHGRAPAFVSLDTDGRSYVLDVADHAAYSTPQVAPGRAPGAGGFGLLIACDLADAVGWYQAEPVKHVWARFAL